MSGKLYWMAAAALAVAMSMASAADRQPELHLTIPASHIGTVPSADKPMRAKAAPTSCTPGSNVKMWNGAVICGYENPAQPGIYSYTGIRYATVPGRWLPPLQLDPMQTQALAPGAICPQAPVQAPPVMAEDCLFLNIWAPGNTIMGTLPVMVFIHGGAFITGSGSSPLFDGTMLARQQSGIVVVTINYRLGALGFMAGNAQNLASTGNFGLLDQQTALNWVRTNIAAFGGNPFNVTIFGESAGAMSVGLHTMDIPSSNGLFAKAIMESNPMGQRYLRATSAEAVGNQFIQYLCKKSSANTGTSTPNCKGTASWWADPNIVSTADIITAQAQAPAANTVLDIASNYIGIRSLPWQPYVDGTLVTGEPYNGFAPGTNNKVPVMLGMNADEGVLFGFELAAGTMPLGGNFATEPPEADYQHLVYYGMGQTYHNRDAIMGSSGKYPPANGTTYYSPSGAAFAAVVNDFSFFCGNELAANNIVAQGGTVYVYNFTQPPFFDLYNPAAIPAPQSGQPDMRPDQGACDPSTGHVCHGNELPYVFNNFASIGTNSGGKYQPLDSDLGLGVKMNGAWGYFAATGTPPGPWAAYTTTGANQYEAAEMNGAVAPGTLLNIDQTGSCSSFWLPTAGQLSPSVYTP